MKNNKGLTLVELLGVLIVLSMIVMIVTPVVTKNLKSSRISICKGQLESLVAASENWLTDQINDSYDTLYLDGVFQVQIVTGETLLNQGYVSTLEPEYKSVQIEISKSGDSYSYTILDKSKYCK